MKRAIRARGVRARLSALLGLTLMGGALLSGSGVPARTPDLIPTHDPATCARPALWVVSDSDTTIYLFGTIHTHDGRTHWFDHAVRLAFDASDELVLETIIPAQVPRVAAPAGSGLAAARAAVRSGGTIGLSVKLGADQVLQRAAEAGGKPIHGLESFAEQMLVYQSLAPPAPKPPPAIGGGPDPALAAFMRHLVDSWDRGDARPIEAVVGAVQAQSPSDYARLFSSRNGHWAAWIAQRLEQPGTVFVAVGSGHLVGADSVQRRLAAVGVRSARIN